VRSPEREGALPRSRRQVRHRIGYRGPARHPGGHECACSDPGFSQLFAQELLIGNDHEKVHGLPDPAALCHVSYVLEGQPYCTPTLFWRENTRLYWHGSSASRMLRNLSDGQSACLTVTHLDSLVLARSGFDHSVDYRSVMAFGHARLVTDPEEKQSALVMMVDRFFPGRTAGLRQTPSRKPR
jgi:nitroimidazol reductase NimA-like FMN-containing flavoprotein (pyridoxamine 5'-phosphate oxidase superfamily)